MNFAGKLVAQENLILKVSRVDLQLGSILVYQLEEKDQIEKRKRNRVAYEVQRRK